MMDHLHTLVRRGLVVTTVAVCVTAALASAQTREEEARKHQHRDQESAELESARRSRKGPSADPREQKIDAILAELEADAENPDLHYRLANAYHDAGYLHSALQHFNESIRIDSSLPKAWVNRGVVLKELNRHDEAVESFEKALEIAPDDALAHVNLGDELLLQKKYQQAVDEYRRALAIDSESAAAYYSLAISFAETGMYRDAARAWRRCAELAAKQQGDDSETVKRATENAKLMEEIVADAAKELEERAKIKQQIEHGEHEDEERSD